VTDAHPTPEPAQGTTAASAIRYRLVGTFAGEGLRRDVIRYPDAAREWRITHERSMTAGVINSSCTDL